MKTQHCFAVLKICCPFFGGWGVAILPARFLTAKSSLRRHSSCKDIAHGTFGLLHWLSDQRQGGIPSEIGVATSQKHLTRSPYGTRWDRYGFSWLRIYKEPDKLPFLNLEELILYWVIKILLGTLSSSFKGYWSSLYPVSVRSAGHKSVRFSRAESRGGKFRVIMESSRRWLWGVTEARY